MCRGMTMGGGVSSYKTFIRLMAPLAPFITEEIWHMLGEEGSVHKQPWPERGDMSYLASGGVSVVVQLDGKLQRVLTLPKDASESEDNIINAVRKDMALAKKIYSKKVKKTVFIPGKLINFVT